MILPNEKRRRIWCHGPKPEYMPTESVADPDQWFIAARTIPLVRPDKDIIILPGGSGQVREFFEFCSTALGIKPWQVLWTSGKNYLLDVDIEESLLPRIQQTVDGQEWEVIPYASTKPFLRWASKVSARILGDDSEWIQKWGNKGIFYPSIREERRNLENTLSNIQTARGYRCLNTEELLIAYRTLLGCGVADKFVIKPTKGFAGEGILFVSTEEEIIQYQFPMGEVILEEYLRIDCNRGKVVASSIQYCGSQLIVPPVDQIIEGISYRGNIFPSHTSKQFQKKLIGIAGKVLSFLAPTGFGGFDFVSVKEIPVMIDFNGGRFTAAHPARIFHMTYAPRTSFRYWKIIPTKSIGDFWRGLQKRNIAFDVLSGNQKGVFPICYLPNMWGMLIAFGSTESEIDRFANIAEECAV